MTRIDLNERGAYERFGSAATILKPGLHLVLPWPFGVVRHVEFGVIHSALLSYGDQGAPAEVPDTSTAEGDPPASANRLWDSKQPTDVSYIIASSEQNRQSFQTVSASVRVLYRIGLRDTDARAALYHEEDPNALVRSLAGRLLAQFFASRTLPSVLGESQGVIARDLRVRLRQALARIGSGIDIVAVTIETIHPPSRSGIRLSQCPGSRDRGDDLDCHGTGASQDDAQRRPAECPQRHRRRDRGGGGNRQRGAGRSDRHHRRRPSLPGRQPAVPAGTLLQ